MSSLIRQSHITNNRAFWLASTQDLSLNSLQTNSIIFNPDSNVMTVSGDVLYLDGHPVAVRLSLRFTEVEPLHRKRIQDQGL